MAQNAAFQEDIKSILEKSSGFAKGVSGPAGPVDGGEESKSEMVAPVQHGHLQRLRPLL